MLSSPNAPVVVLGSAELESALIERRAASVTQELETDLIYSAVGTKYGDMTLVFGVCVLSTL